MDRGLTTKESESNETVNLYEKGTDYNSDRKTALGGMEGRAGRQVEGKGC